MKIPFFEYPKHYLNDRDNILKIFDEVSSRGAFIMQKDVREFENSLVEYLKCSHAIGVANATDGLEMCWLSVGLKKGDEVICSGHTMLATAASIKLSGGTPIPVDIGEDNLIDPSAIQNAINENTVGIMPTQLNGRTCEMDTIMEIAKKHNLYVVEDAAQALGSKYKGQYAGTFGHSSAFSFFPAKVLGCLGDGGAVITNDYSTFDKIYQLHDHGRDEEGEIKSWGRNSRLDNLNAAILNYKLKNYHKIIERRREIASLYDTNLNDISQLKLPPRPNENMKNFDIYQNYELEAERRDELKDYLLKKGIGTLIQWGGKAIHQWENLDIKAKLPKTESFFRKALMLPMNTFISNKDIKYITNTIKNFYHSDI